MIKLFRLIEVLLKGETNYDRVKMSKEYNVTDSSEIKFIILGIFLFIYGLIIYYLSSKIVIFLKDDILLLAYILSYLILLFYDLTQVRNRMFTKDENEVIFSFPINNKTIIVSKLVPIYLINLVILFAIMFPIYYSLYKIKKIVDIVSFSYILCYFTLPLIPIIISSFYAFIDSYYSISNKKKKYLLFKGLVIFLILIMLYLLFNGVNIYNIDSIINRFGIFNPLLYLYRFVVVKQSFISILLVVCIPIVLFYYFVQYLSFNYTHFISYIKGVKKTKNNKIIVGKRRKRITSMIIKEFNNLIHHKLYFRSCYFYGIVLSIMYFLLSFYLRGLDIVNNRMFPVYLMIMLSFIAAVNCTTIHSLSLEKDNLKYYKSFPVRFYKVLLSKYLFNILIVLIIIIFNTLVTLVFYKLKWYQYLLVFINPLITTSFISILGLALDYRFINFNNKDDVYIIKNRIVSYVPTLTLMLVSVVLNFMVLIDYIYVIMLLFTAINIVCFMIVLIYLLFNYRRIYKNMI